MRNETTKNGAGDIWWINPLGGMGDALMLGGVLQQAKAAFPERSFRLARRTGYTNIFRNHPAVDEIGHPPKNVERIMGCDYWSAEPLGPENQRAFQILARMFGLKTPVEETLFAPVSDEQPPVMDYIPWKDVNILIAPDSDSPRKCMHPGAWHIVVEELTRRGAFVVQTGRIGDVPIQNAYGVMGATKPLEAIKLVEKCDVVLTSDNFIMHAAHMVGTPAVVLWGPTESEVYGYPGQVHLHGEKTCGLADKCLGPDFPDNYSKPCPVGEEQHCMNKIAIESVLDAIDGLL